MDLEGIGEKEKQGEESEGRERVNEQERKGKQNF